jgi:hypothetical protein
MDNLDGFQKLVSTQWTFSISILIGLERQVPQGYINSFNCWHKYSQNVSLVNVIICLLSCTLAQNNHIK